MCISLLSMLVLKVRATQSPSARNGPGALGYAQEAYDRGDPEKAISVLTDYLREHPDNFDASELMGLCLVAEKRFGDAKQFLATAVRENPDFALARANLATDLAELNEADGAETQFKKALALDPGGAELNHNFGEFYAARGRMNEAVPLLEKAQQLHPTYNNGYDLALVEMNVGELDAAEREVKVLLLQQKTAELHSLLGSILEKKRDYLAAADEMQLAAEMDPSEENLFNWGAELLRHQTLGPAVQIFQTGSKKFPSSWRLEAGLGVSQYLLGNKSAAVTAFCAAIDLDPKDRRPYFFLSKVHGISKEQTEAVSRRFERYVNESPRDARARFYYAMNLWDSSDSEPATAANMQKIKMLLQAAIALDPKYADAHLQLGILYSQESNDKEALTEFESAVSLDPSLNVARYHLAHTLIQLGRRDEGEKELAKWKNMDAEEGKESERRQEIMQFLYNNPSPH